MFKGYNLWCPSWAEGDAKIIKDVGLNVVRAHLYMNDTNYDHQLASFNDVILPDCKSVGLDIILNIRRNDMDFPAIEQEWRGLITKYDHEPLVVAYDLVNEPKDPDFQSVEEYQRFIHAMVYRLRGWTQKTFIIEAGKGPDPGGFDTLTPINDPNIIYSFHAYWPYPFTHQGIKGKTTGFTWPGEYYGKPRTVADIEKDYKEAINFQKDYDVPIFVGELGCSIYGDEQSSENWVKDTIGLCGKYKWGWCVHSWNGKAMPSRLDIVKELADG